ARRGRDSGGRRPRGRRRGRCRDISRLPPADCLPRRRRNHPPPSTPDRPQPRAPPAPTKTSCPPWEKVSLRQSLFATLQMKRAGRAFSQWSLCVLDLRVSDPRPGSSWSLASPFCRPHSAVMNMVPRMNWLWVTLADPDPATNGQLIYSEGLIRAARDAGASLCVVGLSRREKLDRPLDAVGLAWQLGEERSWPRWRRTLRSLPEVAQRGVSASMSRALARALAARPWEAIVFDSICAGWALPAVLQHQTRVARPARMVYIAHNHEITVARRIADAASGARRLHKGWDALRMSRFERKLIAASDLVTSNTPEDCRTFSEEAGSKPVILLPPGYGGPRVPERTIDASVPRRAVVIGSFDWPPKRISLERFLTESAP